MEVTTTESHGHQVFVVAGAVDLAATPRLHDALRRFTERGGPLAVDLTAVSVLDDAAQGLLLGAAATVRATGRRLVLVVADGPVRRRLADTRLDRVVDVVIDVLPEPDDPIADADGAVS